MAFQTEMKPARKHMSRVAPKTPTMIMGGSSKTSPILVYTPLVSDVNPMPTAKPITALTKACPKIIW